MKMKYLFLIVFIISLNLPCNSQKENNIILEGKWKVVDWTYISFVGRGLDKDEKEKMNESINNLVLDFKLNHIFSSNKPEILNFLEGKKYVVNEIDMVVINNNYYPFIAKDEKNFLQLSNVILEIEKIESYKNAKLKLEKLPILESKSKNKVKKINEVFSTNELDELPKLEKIEFDQSCSIDCLHDFFNSNMKYFIDYSEINADVSYFVEFIIDKTGELSNISIRSRYNESQKNIESFNSITNTKPKLSLIEKSIVNSILYFKDRNVMIAGKKGGQKVNTKLDLEIRLIPK